MRLFDLTEKVAIVTGGNGGIGLGMAEGLADAGASIVLTGRNQEKAGAALKSLEKHGRTAHFVRADVTRAVECRTVVAEAVERLRPAGYPGQQRRHLHPQGASGLYRGGVASGAGHKPDRSIFVCSGRVSSAKAGGSRQDHQYRIDDVAVRRTLCDALRCEQRRNRANDTGSRYGLGERQRSGKRGPSWLDRHGIDAHGSPAGRGSARAGGEDELQRGAGEFRQISQALPCFWPARRPTLLQAPR